MNALYANTRSKRSLYFGTEWLSLPAYTIEYARSGGVSHLQADDTREDDRLQPLAIHRHLHRDVRVRQRSGGRDRAKKLRVRLLKREQTQKEKEKGKTNGDNH